MRGRLKWLLAAWLLAAGCVADQEKVEPRLETGEIHIALGATGASGTQYVLAGATFRFVGPESGTLVVPDDDPVARVALAAGSYSLQLLDGWLLQRELEDGSREPVLAELVSANPITLAVMSQRVARAVFRFRVGSEEVELGDGLLEITAVIDDLDASRPGEAGMEADARGELPALVTLNTTPFDLPAGGEVYLCQNFANPFGRDVGLARVRSTLAASALQVFVFNGSAFDDDGELSACSGEELQDFVHASSDLIDDVSYPAGVGRVLPGAHGLRVRVHYLNTTAAPVVAQAQIELHPVARDEIANVANGLYLTHATLSVGPGASTSVARDLALPYGLQLLHATPLTWSAGTHVALSAGGVPLYDRDITAWQNPASVAFAPPRALAAGTILSWSCSFTNASASTKTFGPGALSDEQCTVLGAFVASSAQDQGSLLLAF
jgi:hypothetical protein